VKRLEDGHLEEKDVERIGIHCKQLRICRVAFLLEVVPDAAVGGGLCGGVPIRAVGGYDITAAAEVVRPPAITVVRGQDDHSIGTYVSHIHDVVEEHEGEG